MARRSPRLQEVSLNFQNWVPTNKARSNNDLFLFIFEFDQRGTESIPSLPKSRSSLTPNLPNL